MDGGLPRVVVAGGSLGGLTAALHLKDIGCDVTVHERSRSPLEGRGAGIVLHPASVRYPIPDFDGAVVPGRRRINFVWYRNVNEGAEIDLMTDHDGVKRSVSLGPGAVQKRHVEALFQAAEDELPNA